MRVPQAASKRTSSLVCAKLRTQPSLPDPPSVVKNGRLVGCQARSERMNVYAVQMFGPDQAARDKEGKHEWAKPFTWCESRARVGPRRGRDGRAIASLADPACAAGLMQAGQPGRRGCCAWRRRSILLASKRLRADDSPLPLPTPPPPSLSARQAEHGVRGACKGPGGMGRGMGQAAVPARPPTPPTDAPPPPSPGSRAQVPKPLKTPVTGLIGEGRRRLLRGGARSPQAA